MGVSEIAFPRGAHARYTGGRLLSTELLPADIRDLYEVHEWRHACAILHRDFPSEWQDLVDNLRAFRVNRSGHLGRWRKPDCSRRDWASGIGLN